MRCGLVAVAVAILLVAISLERVDAECVCRVRGDPLLIKCDGDVDSLIGIHRFTLAESKNQDDVCSFYVDITTESADIPRFPSVTRADSVIVSFGGMNIVMDQTQATVGTNPAISNDPNVPGTLFTQAEQLDSDGNVSQPSIALSWNGAGWLTFVSDSCGISVEFQPDGPRTGVNVILEGDDYDEWVLGMCLPDIEDEEACSNLNGTVTTVPSPAPSPELSNSLVVNAQRWERPIFPGLPRCISEALKLMHSGVIVTLANGEKWLVHKGDEYGVTSATVATQAYDLSRWRATSILKDVKESKLTVGDYIRAGGPNYHWFKDNCHDASRRMIALPKIVK